MNLFKVLQEMGAKPQQAEANADGIPVRPLNPAFYTGIRDEDELNNFQQARDKIRLNILSPQGYTNRTSMPSLANPMNPNSQELRFAEPMNTPLSKEEMLRNEEEGLDSDSSPDYPTPRRAAFLKKHLRDIK